MNPSALVSLPHGRKGPRARAEQNRAHLIPLCMGGGVHPTPVVLSMAGGPIPQGRRESLRPGPRGPSPRYLAAPLDVNPTLTRRAILGTWDPPRFPDGPKWKGFFSLAFPKASSRLAGNDTSRKTQIWLSLGTSSPCRPCWALFTPVEAQAKKGGERR